MPAPTHVRLRHSDGREWDCPARAVPHWEAKGWKKATAGKKTAAKKTTSRRSGGGKKKTTAATKTAASKPAGD